MNKPTLKAGIIGSGFAAKFHFDALQRVHTIQVEITGAYSPTYSHLQAFTSTRNIQLFNSIDELINASDILHVCTPPVTHEAIVIAALEQNKHVIVEKPFTGYFGDGSENFNGDTFSKQQGFEHTLSSIERMLAK
jgi:predicted dehydrogenase